MCVSTSPADFKATKIYMGVHDHPTEGRVEVLMYENTAQNRNNRRGGTSGWSSDRGSWEEPLKVDPNCMILHIPAGKPLTPDNFIDSSNFPHILDDMIKAVSWDGTRGGVFAGATRGGPQVFSVGSYTVLLTPPDRVHEGLDQLDQSVRPSISDELIEFYLREYPRHTLALCCFNAADFKSHPMIVWYKTWEDWDGMFTDAYIRFPAIDAHTGKPPIPGRLVNTDHWLLTNVYGGCKPHYSELSGDLPWFIPDQVAGFHCDSKLGNGDFALYKSEQGVTENNEVTVYRFGPGDDLLQKIPNVYIKSGRAW